MEVHAQDEIPKIEMSRKQLPKNVEIITIIPKDLGWFCIPYVGGKCDGIVAQCCDGLRCSLPFFGGACQKI